MQRDPRRATSSGSVTPAIIGSEAEATAQAHPSPIPNAGPLYAITGLSHPERGPQGYLPEVNSLRRWWAEPSSLRCLGHDGSEIPTRLLMSSVSPQTVIASARRARSNPQHARERSLPEEIATPGSAGLAMTGGWKALHSRQNDRAGVPRGYSSSTHFHVRMVEERGAMGNDRAAAVGLRLVVMLGVVSLLSDMTYEGARSVSGPFLELPRGRRGGGGRLRRFRGAHRLRAAPGLRLPHRALGRPWLVMLSATRSTCWPCPPWLWRRLAGGGRPADGRAAGQGHPLPRP